MEIELLYGNSGKDEDGFIVESEEKITVYAEEVSITRYEFYASHKAGITLSAAYRIRLEDWEQTKHMQNGRPAYADKVVIDGAKYEIVRTYKKEKGSIEIYCA